MLYSSSQRQSWKWQLSQVCFKRSNVIYWPWTESSIKRCTHVNKRKKSGSRWALEYNITRCPSGLRQLETGYLSENQLQTEGFGPLVTPRLSNPSQDAKKVLLWSRKNLGQYSSPSLSPTHLSHTTNITLSDIKCERFILEVYSFVIEVVNTSWL